MVNMDKEIFIITGISSSNVLTPLTEGKGGTHDITHNINPTGAELVLPGNVLESIVIDKISDFNPL